jgi:hypothetical protein
VSLPTPSLPDSTGAYTLRSGSFEAQLPTTINSTADTVGGTSYYQDIPGRDGFKAIRFGNFAGRNINLSGVIMDSATVTNLKRVLSQPRIEVVRDNLVMVTEKQGLSITEVVYDELWRVSIDLASPDYFWESQSTTTTSANPTSVTNAGDLDTYPTVNITAGVGGLASFSLTTGGRNLVWSGSLLEGETVTIDCGRLTVVRGTESALDEMNNAFFVAPPRLLPGSNAIVTDLIGTASFTISYKEKYL